MQHSLRAFFPVLLLVSCSAVPITIDRAIPEQVVAGNPLSPVLPAGLEFPIPLDIDLEAEAEAMNAGPVQRVTLESVRLDITSTEEPPGDTDDWDFVSSIRVFVESSASGSDLPRVQVAVLDPTPDGQRRLQLDTDTSVNLKRYVEEGARLVAEVSGRAPPDDVSYGGQVTLGLSFL
jgi:hypothetical protein